MTATWAPSRVWSCRSRRRRRWSTSRTASPRATWRRAPWRWRRPRRCFPRGRSMSRSSIQASGGRAPIWWSPPVTASMSAPTTACCRWPPAARGRSTGSKRPGFGASRSARRFMAATCSRRPRAGWPPARPPRTPGSPLESMVELSAPPLHRRDGVIEGEVIHVDGFGNLITSLPAEVVERAGADATVEVEAGAGHFEPQLGRTFSDVETGRAHRLHRQRRPAGDRPPQRLRRAPPRRRARDDRPPAEPDLLKLRALVRPRRRCPLAAFGGCSVGQGSGSADGGAFRRRLRQRHELRNADGAARLHDRAGPLQPQPDLLRRHADRGFWCRGRRR